MKKMLAAVVAVALFAGMTQAVDPPEVKGAFARADSPPVVKDREAMPAPLAHSVVYVTQDLGAGRTAGGTGTAIAAENGRTLVLTNAHVAQAGRPTRVTYWHEGKPYESPARFLEGSTVTDSGPNQIAVHGPDLALLVLEGAELRTVELAAAIPGPGESVSLFGFGGAGLNGTVPIHKTGRTLAPDGWQTMAGDPIQRTSIQTVNGDSGAGIFNEAGQLVAVHWGGNDKKKLGSAVRLDTVHAFTVQVLERKGLFTRLKNRLAARRISAALGKAWNEPGRTFYSLIPAAPAAKPANPPPVKAATPAAAAAAVSNCPGGICQSTGRARFRR